MLSGVTSKSTLFHNVTAAADNNGNATTVNNTASVTEARGSGPQYTNAEVIIISVITVVGGIVVIAVVIGIVVKYRVQHRFMSLLNRSKEIQEIVLEEQTTNGQPKSQVGPEGVVDQPVGPRATPRGAKPVAGPSQMHEVPLNGPCYVNVGYNADDGVVKF